MTCLKKDPQNFSNKTRHIGQVTEGSKKNSVCIPGNSVITMLGCTNKIPSIVTSLVEQAEQHKLPLGITVNRCVAKTKAMSISINTTKQNIWLQQPLLAAKLHTAEHHPVEHRANMEMKGDDIDISFLPVVSDTISIQLEQVEATSTGISPPDSSEKSVFGPRPDTKATDFNFEAEIQCPPFKLNLGEDGNMTHIQQGWFIDLIYDHPEVFSLHNEDLGFCNWIKHTILMTMDRPVYLAQCIIPHNYKGKCVNVWTPSCNRELLGYHKVHMHPRW